MPTTPTAQRRVRHLDMSERPVAAAPLAALLAKIPAPSPGRFWGRHPVPAELRPEYEALRVRLAVHDVLAAHSAGKTVSDIPGVAGVVTGSSADAVPGQRPASESAAAGDIAPAATPVVGQRIQPDSHTVLIAPEGVFAVTHVHVSKAMVLFMKDTALVDGRETDLIGDAERFAQYTTERLATRVDTPTIRPVLVVTGFRRLDLRQTPSSVTVLSVEGLREWLGRRAPALRPLHVAELTSTARRPGTWGVDEAATTDVSVAEALRLREAFDALDGKVRRATHTRWGWLAGAVTTLSVAATGWVL